RAGRPRAAPADPSAQPSRKPRPHYSRACRAAPMSDTPPAETQRCGFVAIVGAPNAGKSTLLNRLVGSTISILSPPLHTTRHPLAGGAAAGHRVQGGGDRGPPPRLLHRPAGLPRPPPPPPPRLGKARRAGRRRSRSPVGAGGPPGTQQGGGPPPHHRRAEKR